MSRYKVVLTDNIFPDLKLEREMLKEVDAELVIVKNRKEIKKECLEADAVINTYEQITEDIIEGMQKCKIIIRNGIGVNTIDMDACNNKRIIVANVPDYCVDEVATHVIGLIFCLNRKIALINKYVKNGDWDVKNAIPIYPLNNRVLGMVGFGKIARLVNDRIKAFGMKVICYDPYVSDESVAKKGAKKVDFEELVKTSDYISIHAPLTSETLNMFNLDVFKKMKNSAYILNTARGPIINEGHLVKALEQGMIEGAGLDVLTNDEIHKDNPLISMDNVVITSHIAWYSEESIVRRRIQTIESVVNVLKGGEPASFLNKQYIT